MLRHLLLAIAVLLLIVGVANLASTSMLLGVVAPVLGLLLGFVWVLWTAQERISERQQAMPISPEEMERLVRAMREKKQAQAAAQLKVDAKGE